MRRISLALLLGAAMFDGGGAVAQMGHQHDQEQDCASAELACARTVTPTMAPDGTLWLAFVVGGRVLVTHSTDLGQSFAAPVAVNPAPVHLDNGPDARPKIAVDAGGRVFVAYAIFKDDKFNGEVFFSRSTDHGASFETPRPLVGDQASQRFETISVDAGGALFAAWLDKRNVVAAKNSGTSYVGAGLAYSWSVDGGVSFTPSRIALDNTCECCRLGVAFAGPARPAIVFRNTFGGTVRDHAVITFADHDHPGAPHRVSVDNWVIDACPHQGPSLAISPAGTYHAVWFTEGTIHKGLFYARSTDGGQSFSDAMALGNPSHDLSRPYTTALNGSVWLAWKDFDGDRSSAYVMVSHDDGKSWAKPQAVAEASDASDHPMLVNDGRRAYLSWMSRKEGYRFLTLEDYE